MNKKIFFTLMIVHAITEWHNTFDRMNEDTSETKKDKIKRDNYRKTNAHIIIIYNYIEYEPLE